MNQQTTNEGRQRIRQLFSFLQAFNEKKNPVATQIDEQPQRWWWKSLPAHEAVKVAPFADPPLTDLDDPSPGDDWVIRVRRPDLRDAPSPPASIAEWVEDGWEDPRKQYSVSAQRQVVPGGMERFEDDPDRTSALAEWAALRSEWAAAAKTSFEANAVFNWLFEIHADMQREEERHELVLGDGILNWRRPSGGVHFPLLLQRLRIDYDASIPEFVVSEADRPPELNSALLRRAEVDGRAIGALSTEADSQRIAPLGAGRTEEFLRRLVTTIDPQGAYLGDGAPEEERDFPRVGRAPVMFLRSRAQGFQAAISNILEDIELRETFPESLLAVAGIHARQGDPASDLDSLELGDEASDVLLSKEANQEQLEIARRLARYSAVLVQGPPGTGKTHTIANLIGHLLAQGKSVLVTSHTTKALRVLREKVVEDLQPLCVSVLEGDSTSRDQLASSVTGISARLTSSNRDQLLRETASLQSERQMLLERLHERRARLLTALSAEYAEVVVNGRSLTTEQAGRLVAEGAGRDDWIPGDVRGALPLSLAQVQALYATNGRVTEEEERLIVGALPALADLPTATEFARLAEGLSAIEAAGLTGYRPGIWSPAPRSPDLLRSFLTDALAAFNDLAQGSNWQLAAAAAGAEDLDERAPWTNLMSLLDETAQAARAKRLAVATFGPQLADGFGGEEALAVIAEVREHIVRGGTLNTVTLFRHRRWRKVVQESRCVGSPPWTRDALDGLATVPAAAVAWEALSAKWALLMGPLQEDLPGSERDADEAMCRRFAAGIGGALDLLAGRIRSLAAAGDALGLAWHALVPGLDEDSLTPERWREVAIAVESELPQVVESEAARLERKEFLIALNRAEEELRSSPGAASADSAVGKLLRAARDRDAVGYEAGYHMLADLLNRSDAVRERRDLLRQLSESAPDWAEAIRRRVPPHAAPEPPGDARQAWEWKQVWSELDQRSKEQIDVLITEIESLRAELRGATARLIDRKAWAEQMRKTDPEARMQLALWLQTVKKIGKGSGRNVPKLRRAAQEHMGAARHAVPVWIAPLSRVAESFDARTSHFDVVIIDEASQCDVMGLIALYLGSQVIVVGDDQQVTPDAVGDRIDTANALIDTFLGGIPGNQLYDGQYSIYQIAQTAFPGVTKLREHFRSVPDIIRFSNGMCYDWEIRPLRDSGDAKVRPPVIPYRVDGGASDDKRNPEEAAHVASLIIAAAEQPEYAGLTFGAISLVGGEQGREIETLLRNHMSLAEYDKRRILCGTPPQFQGDERDVVFLSMVDGPPDSPPLTLRDAGPREMYKKRYNVAASRARDQLWVVYSLDPGRDLKTNDLRWKLIDWARNPSALHGAMAQAQARAESPLERGVIQRLVSAGFPVTPQFEVGGYRIDIVVGTEKRRLAVECDGDRYHTQDNLQQDLDRQALLERMGWHFVRIRGSEFFRDPDRALRPLFKRLEESGIDSARDVSQGSEAVGDGSELVERVKSRAALIRDDWGRGHPWRARPAVVPGATPRPGSAAAQRSERKEPEPGGVSKSVPASQPAPTAEARVTPKTQASAAPPRPASSSRQPSFAGMSAESSPIEAAVSRFRKSGFRVDDFRVRNGALWVYDSGRKLAPEMTALRAQGVRFTYFPKRGGWWIK